MRGAPHPDRRQRAQRRHPAADLHAERHRPDLLRDHPAQGQRGLRRGQFPRAVRVHRARPGTARRDLTPAGLRAPSGLTTGSRTAPAVGGRTSQVLKPAERADFSSRGDSRFTDDGRSRHERRYGDGTFRGHHPHHARRLRRRVDGRLGHRHDRLRPGGDLVHAVADLPPSPGPRFLPPRLGPAGRFRGRAARDHRGAPTRQPSARKTWTFLAAAIVTYNIGNLIDAYLRIADLTPFPSLADLFYLAFFPVLFAGFTVACARARCARPGDGCCSTR